MGSAKGQPSLRLNDTWARFGGQLLPLLLPLRWQPMQLQLLLLGAGPGLHHLPPLPHLDQHAVDQARQQGHAADEAGDGVGGQRPGLDQQAQGVQVQDVGAVRQLSVDGHLRVEVVQLAAGEYHLCRRQRRERAGRGGGGAEARAQGSVFGVHF